MEIIKLTKDNFEQEVLKSEKPVLVDFYADWCGPCQMMAPVIGQLAGEYEGRVKIGKLNVDENPDIAVQYKVMSIPTMIASFWGMNVPVPLAHSAHGFLILVIVSLILTIFGGYILGKKNMF